MASASGETPINTSEVARKVTPERVLMTTLVVAPASVVLRVPVAETVCVAVFTFA